MQLILDAEWPHKRKPGSKRVVIIVLEFCAGGDLFGYIAPPVGRAFPERLARTFFSQLLEALAHAHTRGVCHRDLKPENLLVGADGALRVSDWCGDAA